jgi:hypothetical protein
MSTDAKDLALGFFASPDAIVLAHLKEAWPYLSLDDQRRWCLETNYSKNPSGASWDLIDTVQRISMGCVWEERYGDYYRFMHTPPRSHNGAPYWYEFSTFERCAQQGELFVDCALGHPPYQNASGKRVTAMLGPTGRAWQEEECCVYVVKDGWAGGRELIIQNNHCDHAHIRLRADVSNAEALRLGQALLAAIAAPPKPWED